MIKQVFLSLLLTCMVSAGLGYALCVDVQSFWQIFVGVTVAQFLIFYVLTEVRRSKQPQIVEEDDPTNEFIALQTAVVSCPCGNNSFTAPIFLNTDNLFVCDKCNSKFRVEMSYDSVILTEQLNLETVFDALKAKEQG